MAFQHTPVLLTEALEFLNIRPDGVYVDCTLGGAGHACEIVRQLERGWLIGVDQDQDAITAASERLRPFASRVKIVRENFSQMRRVFADLGIEKADGFLLDLGVSAFQLTEASRGFSYRQDADLSMKMDASSDLSAYDVVNSYEESELVKLFFAYGEEKFSKQIARAIALTRNQKPIRTTFELADIIKGAIPKKATVGGPNPSRRVFQAIRIEVNRELAVLSGVMDDLIDLLKPGGRICLIDYHSLEDRIIKQAFKKAENPCVCPAHFPVCVCGRVPQIRIVTKKPVLPNEAEIAANHRARSAKLRAAEKIAP